MIQKTGVAVAGENDEGWVTLEPIRIAKRGLVIKSLTYIKDENFLLIDSIFEKDGGMQVEFAIVKPWEGYDLRIIAIDNTGKIYFAEEGTLERKNKYDRSLQGMGFEFFKDLKLSNVEELKLQLKPVNAGTAVAGEKEEK